MADALWESCVKEYSRERITWAVTMACTFHFLLFVAISSALVACWGG